MPDLFSPATLQKMCADVKITGDQYDAAQEWLALLEGDKLQKEVPNYPIFMACILDKLLGYKIKDIKYESDNVEFQFRDSQGRPLGCFEVKGTLTKDLFAAQNYSKGEHSTPIKQTWDYMGSIGLEYGICTNYRKFALITKKHGYSKYHLFDFEGVRDDIGHLREFLGVFSRERIASGFVERAHTESTNEDKRLTDEFYDLYGRTRLMLVKEFESSGAKRADAVASAQTLLNRLVFIFFAQDSGLVKDGNVFVDGVIDVLGARLGDRSRRVWSYMADELFPDFDEGSASPSIFGFNGGLFDAPFPPRVQIKDRRTAEFFSEFKVRKRRRSWEFKEKIRAAVERHPDLNPIIKNLLAMSSYDFKSQIRVTILGHIFEKSISELDDLLGLRTSRRKREGVFYTPEYVTRHICRSTIIPWLSKTGDATDPPSLVAEYAGDMAELDKKLRAIKILDPACGSGAFLIEAAATLLSVYREIKAYKSANGGLAHGTLESEIADASPLEVVRNNLYGMDISPQSVEITQLAMFLMTASLFERLPDLSHNIVVWNSVAGAAAGSGGGWDAAFPTVFRDGGGFDIIIGNPPYVRQEDLPDKAALAIPANSRLVLTPGFKIPRKSDLSSYFYYHSLHYLAREGGGARLGFIASDGWLNHDYGLPLQRAMLDNCRIDALIRPAYNVFDDADIKTVVSLLTNLPAGPDHRVPFATIRHPSHFDDWRGNVVARSSQGDLEPGNWFAHFAGNTPPLKVPSTTMGDVGKVESCIKTGHNEFFVLGQDVIRAYSIKSRFRRPVLSDDIEAGCLENRRASEYLLSVNLTKGKLCDTDGGKSVLRYIEKAESTAVTPKKGLARHATRIPELASVRGRNPWYSLGLDTPPPIFLAIFTDKRIRVYRNNGRFFARNNYASFVPDVPDHTDAFLAFFASSWFALHLEKSGHVAGGGALQVLIEDFERTPVPDFGRMGRSAVDKLGKIWNRYCDDLDRTKLDDAVLEVLGYARAERSAMARQLETLISYRTAAPAATAGRG